jgi:hypothetical protein
MIKYKEATRIEKIPSSIICDICLKEYKCEEENISEVQEFHNIDFVGGYGSVFGDGVSVKCDICQHCLKKIIGRYI